MSTIDPKTARAAHIVETRTEAQWSPRGTRMREARPVATPTYPPEGVRFHGHGPLVVGDARPCACGYAVCSKAGPCAPAPSPVEEAPARTTLPIRWLGDYRGTLGFGSGDVVRVRGGDHMGRTGPVCVIEEQTRPVHKVTIGVLLDGVKASFAPDLLELASVEPVARRSPQQEGGR